MDTGSPNSQPRFTHGDSWRFDENGDHTGTDRLAVEPSSSRNHLKLSVGCADSDEDDDCGEGMQHHAEQWFGGTERRTEYHEDFGEDLSADRVRAMIQGDELMFNCLQDDNFAEEVFAPKPPKIMYGYLFGDVVGEGSYAKVKEVVEECTLVRRAVKIIKHHRLRKIPNGAENVQREIKILQKVKHPNVIRLIEVFRNEEKQKLYMVMEFCMGSVQQLIDSAVPRRLSEHETHRFFCELMDGLEYIHSKGIVHKDIKPGNLLLGTNFSLKISDFGVAEELSSFQPTDECVIVQGTPKFQAPELVSGNSRTFSGFKADIWSCGVTLYNMLSGEYPFEGEAIMKLFDNIANNPLVMPTTVVLEGSVQSLLEGMLRKNPDHRLSLQQIKESPWFCKEYEETDWSHRLERKQSVHRPLTVGHALELMFALQPPVGALPDGVGASDETTVSQDDTMAVQPARRNRSILNCIRSSGSP